MLAHIAQEKRVQGFDIIITRKAKNHPIPTAVHMAKVNTVTEAL
ncbi:MAG TPA: hypothetical protein PK856_00410 [Vitreoscilla sp.]|nr:hypothetical protein [Vitreoscilla sp.]